MIEERNEIQFQIIYEMEHRERDFKVENWKD